MSPVTENGLPRRIAVALAGTAAEARALDTVDALSGNGKASISFVVIEDSDLLRAAQLPFALEVCRATNIARRINAGDLSRSVSERTASVLRLVEQTAARAGANWSCSVVRQRTATAVLELIESQDVTLLCTARTFSASARSPEIDNGDNGHVVSVVLDRSAASRRAFRVAQRIARARRLPVAAIVVAATSAGIDQIKSRLPPALLSEEAFMTELVQPAFGDIASRVRDWHSATLVLPVSQLADTPARVSELETGVDCPTVIVK